ncbi:hypothetical protein K4L44_03125 [Halosquirtibacter laminarini]|uniref:Uncharacterized protein n=1 Tax=Halosquirtibacter laminarini TaxID=3374600 RepID=A0AC61NNK3_9BACT|nr:hypothetical protein K4L44_03125 [Prolixibacteraceae bacterium]
MNEFVVDQKVGTIEIEDEFVDKVAITYPENDYYELRGREIWTKQSITPSTKEQNIAITTRDVRGGELTKTIRIASQVLNISYDLVHAAEVSKNEILINDVVDANGVIANLSVKGYPVESYHLELLESTLYKLIDNKLVTINAIDGSALKDETVKVKLISDDELFEAITISLIIHQDFTLSFGYQLSTGTLNPGEIVLDQYTKGATKICDVEISGPESVRVGAVLSLDATNYELKGDAIYSKVAILGNVPAERVMVKATSTNGKVSTVELVIK